jgi:hypothetical protein
MEVNTRGCKWRIPLALVAPLVEEAIEGESEGNIELAGPSIAQH